MQEHYVRLLTDIELGPKQKHVWYRVVESFLGADFAPEFLHEKAGLTKSCT